MNAGKKHYFRAICLILGSLFLLSACATREDTQGATNIPPVAPATGSPASPPSGASAGTLSASPPPTPFIPPDLPPYTAPDRWQDTITDPEGRFTIHIDANIHVPDETAYPIVQIEPRPLTAQQVQGYADTLFPGCNMYDVHKPNGETNSPVTIDSLFNPSEYPNGGMVEFVSRDTGYVQGNMRFARQGLHMEIFQHPLPITVGTAAPTAEPVPATLSEEKAKEIAVQALRDLGIDGMAPISGFYDYIGAQRFYSVVFGRTYQSVPPNYSFFLSSASGNWIYETLSVAVNDEGLLFWEWRSPAQTKQTLSPVNELLSFAQIQQAFRENVIEKGLQSDPDASNIRTGDIYITDIRLGMVPATGQEADENVLVPAWDFYGYAVKTYVNPPHDLDYGELPFGPQENSFLTVNAIDGSVILDRDVLLWISMPPYNRTPPPK